MTTFHPGHLGRGNKIHFLYASGNSPANCNNSVRTRGSSYGDPIAAESTDDLINQIAKKFGAEPLNYLCGKCLSFATTEMARRA